MGGDVEVADAEREIHRVDVFERGREERHMREREDQRQRGQRALRTSRHGAQAQRLVQAAEAIPLQVEADVLIAEGFERRGQAAR